MQKSEYFQDWQPTLRDQKVFELARRYHDECEAYDRTVCTGPIVHGGIMPMTPQERSLIHRNAMEVRKIIECEACNFGIERQELSRAIANG